MLSRGTKESVFRGVSSFCCEEKREGQKSMKLSKKRSFELYDAIRKVIVNKRVILKLKSEQDFVLAQAETEIWEGIKHVLGIEDK